MPSNRRTEFASFVLDLLDFMEEKIREARDDESSRPAAIGEAGGAVPVLRDRLSEDEDMLTRFMLVFDVFDGTRSQQPHYAQDRIQVELNVETGWSPQSSRAEGLSSFRCSLAPRLAHYMSLTR
jgi:hypothetical protein